MHVYHSYKTLYLTCEFMAPGSGVQALGWGLYGHRMKMHNLENLLYSKIYAQ